MSDQEWTVEGQSPPKKKAPKKKAAKRKPRKPQIYNKQKRAKVLLKQLKEDHQFDLIDQVLFTYMMAGELEGLEDQIKWRRSIEKDLMGYCFPRLKSTEVNLGSGDTTVLNLMLGNPTQEQPKAAPPIAGKVIPLSGTK